MVWYHFPDPADAPVSRIRPIAGSPRQTTQGLPVRICADATGTPAAILHPDGTPVDNSILYVDERSNIPRFRGPENVLVLWALITGYAPTPIRADIQEQMDERVRPRVSDAASRPAAATVPVGTPWFDPVTGRPAWSDGTSWRGADGRPIDAGPPGTDYETPAGATQKATTAANTAVGNHTVAMDPHGDRAHAQSLVSALDNDLQGQINTKVDSTALNAAVATRETPAGAQAKVDALESDLQPQIDTKASQTDLANAVLAKENAGVAQSLVSALALDVNSDLASKADIAAVNTLGNRVNQHDADIASKETPAGAQAKVDAIPVDADPSVPALRTIGNLPTQAAPGDSVSSPALPGGTAYRLTGMEDWGTALTEATTAAPVDVLVFGDSISTHGTVAEPPWQHITEVDLNFKAGVVMPRTLAMVYGSGGGPVVTSTQGTPTETGHAGYATRLTDGQIITHDFVGTSVAVVYRVQSGDGSVTWRDGAGGAVLGTTNHNGTAKSGRVAFFNGLSPSAHTLHGTASGNVTVEAIKPMHGNAVRVWSATHSGWNSGNFASVPETGLDLMDWLEANGNLRLVITATGTNDNSSTDPERLPALIDAIQARTNSDIIVWHPYRSTYYQNAERAAHRPIVYSLGLPVVDADAWDPSFGPTRTIDGVHPFPANQKLLAAHWSSVLGGDPIGTLSRKIAVQPAIGTGSGDVAPGNVMALIRDDFLVTEEDFVGGDPTLSGSIGTLGWDRAGPGTTVNPIIGTAGHPGNVRVQSGATAGNATAISKKMASHMADAPNGVVAFWFKFGQVTDVRYWLGLSNGGASPFHGMWLCADPATSANWQVVSKFLGTEIGRLVTTAPLVAGRWIKATLTRFGGLVVVNIDGAQVGVGGAWAATEANYANIIVENVAGAQKHIDVDRVQLVGSGFTRPTVPA